MHYIYVDEAGRGPIAWPVYVGIIVVSVKKNMMRWGSDIASLPGMGDGCYECYDDSKIIAESKREELYEKLCTDKKISYSSGSSTSKEIDKNGIVRGIRTAIARALRKYFGEGRFSMKKFEAWVKINGKNLVIIVDGKTDFHMRKLWQVTVEPIVDGDAKVPMIGAASIIAKVERDREMRKYHKKFPQYGFDTHKGYGTSGHYEALKKYGISGLHRKTFLTDYVSWLEEE